MKHDIRKIGGSLLIVEKDISHPVGGKVPIQLEESTFTFFTWVIDK